jgi:hypothetical protein
MFIDHVQEGISHSCQPVVQEGGKDGEEGGRNSMGNALISSSSLSHDTRAGRRVERRMGSLACD